MTIPTFPRFAISSSLFLGACFLVACSDDPPSEKPQARSVKVDIKSPVKGEILVMSEPLAIKADAPLETRTLLEREAVFHDKGEADFLAQGITLKNDGRHAEAVQAFRRALFVDASSKAWAHLGDAYLAMGQKERGLECVQEALKVDAKNTFARRAAVLAYLAENNGNAAKMHAEFWARSNPADAEALHHLGKAYMKLKMWNEAVGAYEDSIAIDPSNVHAFNNLGYSAIQVGDYDTAMEYLERTFDMKEQEPYMANNLGIAYEKAGHGPDALAAYLRALEMKPDYVKAVVNRDRVRKALTRDEQELALEILLELKGPSPSSDKVAISTAKPKK